MVYFLVQTVFVTPLVLLNKDYIFSQGQEEEVFLGRHQGIVFGVCLLIVTALTFLQYLRAALQDPGFINSMMFSKAYQNNNETEISQYNQTQQDQLTANSAVLQPPPFTSLPPSGVHPRQLPANGPPPNNLQLQNLILLQQMINQAI
mmetsp:Transcript_6038/g.10250  ORF Transcript_6038/g.10250 Transcript_6038/m.10250 type:complete len:147 (-) Transcript_6038:465-905(-)